MKLDNCAINADFIMKDGKTYVLEIGGRSGATCLAELVSIYYGYDYYEKINSGGPGRVAPVSSGPGCAECQPAADERPGRSDPLHRQP